MKRRVVLQGMCILLVLAGMRIAAAESEGKDIAAALQAAPPTAHVTMERLKALGALDRFIGKPQSERSPALIAYYQAAVDRALDKLEQDKVAQGARIFQLYSSAVIVQTPETVFAFDLDQGPNKHLDREPSKEGMYFCLTPAQAARLAKLVQYSFHTHEHDDHVDYQLTKALLDAGKTVIVTESNKKLWQRFPWAQKLVVLPETGKEPVKVGPLMVDVLYDHQWDNAVHTKGTPCDAFLVTTPGGVAVMTKGDINCGLKLYDWMKGLKQSGRHVDVVVGSLLFWRGVNKIADWEKLFSPLWLPGHSWEFIHRGRNEAKGNCLAYVQNWRLARGGTRSEKVESLSWGEWIDVAPEK